MLHMLIYIGHYIRLRHYYDIDTLGFLRLLSLLMIIEPLSHFDADGG